IRGILVGSTNAMAVAGAWTNRGVFSPSSGTVIFNGDTEIFGAVTTRFNRVLITGSLTANGRTPLYLFNDWANNGTFNHNFGLLVVESNTTISGNNDTDFNQLTVNGTLTSSTGSIKIAGQFINNGAFLHNGGRVIFNGGTVISGSRTNRFNHLTIWGSLVAPATPLYVAGNWVNHGTYSNSQGTVYFNGNTLISGATPTTFRNVQLLSSTVTAHSAFMNVEGNWDASDGVFYHNFGHVVFLGTNTQTIVSGGAWNGLSNNWRNAWSEMTITNASTGGVIFADGFKAERLTCITPGATLNFRFMDGGSNEYQITESGGLTLRGTAAARLKLRRYGGVLTNQWEIYPSTADGVWNVAYVDAQHSVNSAQNAIYPTNSIDSGNTENWFEPTLVTLAELSALGLDGRVVVRWRTASEMNNAGFHVYRAQDPRGEYSRINASMIRGLGNSVYGGSYEITDAQVVNGERYYYKLESVEFDGSSQMHGPVDAAPEAGAGEEEDGDGRTPLSGTPLPPEAGNSGIYKLMVNEDGLYRLDYPTLSSIVTNLDQWTIANIRLYNQGSEVPLYEVNPGGPAFETNDFLEFYGQALDTRFTDQNVYWLYHATNAGLRIGGSGAGSVWWTTSVVSTAHVELNESYEAQLPDETPDDDHWFYMDDLWIEGNSTNTVTYHPVFPDVADEDQPAVLRVALRGMTKAYQVEARLNGNALTNQAVWTGLSQYVFTSTVPRSFLVSGTNTLTLTLSGTPETFNEWVLLNWVELDYLRSLRATDDQCLFPAASTEASQYKVDGFSGTNVQVFKVAGGQLVALVTNAAVSGSGPFALEFSDSASNGSSFAVVAAGARKTPREMIEAGRSSLRSATNRADILIVAPVAFSEAVAPLASARRAQGWAVQVV
ncbi:MAG: hypothetical protein V2A34_13770, partial [Lentisphaerota bacterium]